MQGPALTLKELLYLQTRAAKEMRKELTCAQAPENAILNTQYLKNNNINLDRTAAKCLSYKNICALNESYIVHV